MAEVVAEYKVKVDDAVKNLNKLEGEVKDVDKTLDKTGKEGSKSIDKVGTSAKTTTSTFSKMKVAVVAAFAVMATAAIAFGREAINLAAKAEGITTAFNKLNNPNLLNDLRKATRGTVTDVKLMQAAIRAKNFQVPLEKLASFFEFATKRSIETGESVDYLVNSIVDGIGRKSTLVLDNLGISATELQAEIQKTGDFGLAAANIIEKGLRETGDVADTTAIQIARLNTAWDNFKTKSGTVIISVANQLALSLGFIEANQAAMDEYSKTLSNLSIPSLDKEFKNQEQAVNDAKKAYDDFLFAVDENGRNEKASLEALGNEGVKVAAKREEQLGNQIILEKDLLKVVSEQVKARKDASGSDFDFYTPDQIQALAKANDLTEEEVRNVFFLQNAIAELTKTQKEQGTSVERVKEITDELVPLQAELNALLGKETKLLKERTAELEKWEKAIKEATDLDSTEFEKAISAQADSQIAYYNLLKEERAKDVAREMEALDQLVAVRVSRMQDGVDKETAIIRNALAQRLSEIEGNSVFENELRYELRQEAEDRITEITNEAEQERRSQSQEMFSEFFNVTLDGWARLTNAASQLTQAGYDRDLAALDNKLASEEITREEYDKKRADIAREQFKKQKEFAIIQASINTALGVTNAIATAPNIIVGLVLAAVAAAAGAAEIAVIASQPTPKFEKGGMVKEHGLLKGKSHAQGGIPVEAQGYEYFMPTNPTSKYYKELEAMRHGTFEALMTKRYSVPRIDGALLNGWGDVGKSAELNNITATLKDHNLLAALDRSRQSQTNGFKYLAKVIKGNNGRSGYRHD